VVVGSYKREARQNGASLLAESQFDECCRERFVRAYGLEGDTMTNVRDFIYLDVDRLKSALSQMDQGLLETVSKAGSRTKQLGGSAGAKIATIVGLTGNAECLWTNEQTETRTLHDHIYNLVEDALTESEMLFRIPGTVTTDEIESLALHERLEETTFVLVSGHVIINEFAKMREFMDRFNEIGRFLAYCSVDDATGISKNERDRKMKSEIQANNLALSKEFISGLGVVFDVFYRDRIVIKIRPLEQSPVGTFAGVLRPEFLREPIGTIVYKYGPAPATPWRMLAQVASIPREGQEITVPPKTGGEIEQSMMTVFDSMKEVQAQVQSVSFPEIAVTPIALYRE
jgi:hypothetical protein